MTCQKIHVDSDVIQAFGGQGKQARRSHSGGLTACTLFFRVFSLGFRTDRRRYPTPVGESRHKFACICLDFCDLFRILRFPLKGRFHFAPCLDTPRSLRDPGGF